VIAAGTDWIEQMASSDLPADEKFRLACIESVELYDRNPEIFIYLGEFVPSVERAFPELMDRSKRAWTEIVESVLKLRQGPEPADVQLITYGILGMFSWMHRWYRPGGPRTPTEIGELYARLILEGIEPRA
jgi:hypothetical protein